MSRKKTKYIMIENINHNGQSFKKGDLFYNKQFLDEFLEKGFVKIQD